MQWLNYGRLENLRVCNGEPVFRPPPRAVRRIKFTGDNESGGRKNLGEFCLKAQVVELFDYFDRNVNLTIECLQIQEGLPFLMDAEEVIVE